MSTSLIADGSDGFSVHPTGAPPDVCDEAVDLDVAVARGGRHRRPRRAGLPYLLWILAPLGLALLVSAMSSLPGARPALPYAGPTAGTPPLPLPLVPATDGVVAPSAAPDSGGPGDTPESPAPPAGEPARPGPGGTPPPVAAQPPATDVLTVTDTSPSSPGTSSPSVGGTPVSTVSVSVEAESAALGSALDRALLPGASGGEVVTGLGKNSHRSLTISGIRIPVGGWYRLELGYASPDAVGIEVRTSAGGAATTTCPATGGALRWCATLVRMSAGENSVTVTGTENNTDAVLDRVVLH
jgi:hypothetical protein